MKKCLSKELIFEDVDGIPAEDDRLIHADDGEFALPDFEEIKEKDEKEEIKELEDRKKDIEDNVNDADTPEVKFVDGEGKKIKEMTEKLILEEPSDILVESSDVNESVADYDGAIKLDILLNEIGVDADELLNHFTQWLPADTLDDCINDFIVDEDIEDLFESFIDSSSGDLGEAVLDEKIPKDLAKAYKNNTYKGTHGNNTDLQNSDYDEISPEEALATIKQGNANELRLLINGRLVTLQPGGWGVTERNRIKYVRPDQYYHTKTGKTIEDTAHMPAKHLVQIASKIYRANEKQKDRDLLDARARNRASIHYAGADGPTRELSNRSRWSTPDIRGAGSHYGMSDVKNARKNAAQYRDELAQLERAYEAGDINKDSYEARKLRYQRNIKDYEARELKARGEVRDFEARKRYDDSAAKLREPFDKYFELKRKLDSSSDALNDANSRLERAKSKGSESSIRYKDEYEDLKSELRRIKKAMAVCEMNLESVDEDDAEAVRAAEKHIEDVTKEAADLQQEMNALLRRSGGASNAR